MTKFQIFAKKPVFFEEYFSKGKKTIFQSFSGENPVLRACQNSLGIAKKIRNIDFSGKIWSKNRKNFGIFAQEKIKFLGNSLNRSKKNM